MEGKIRNLKAGQLKPKPELKVADEILSMKDADTNVIVQNLEANIKMREMSVEKRLKNQLLK